VWDPLPELSITSSYVDPRVNSNTFTMGNHMTVSTLTLCQSWLYPSVRDFGFGLWRGSMACFKPCTCTTTDGWYIMRACSFSSIGSNSRVYRLEKASISDPAVWAVAPRIFSLV
jgi:hypothetical protein